MPNDISNIEDNFENMKRFSEVNKLIFHIYLMILRSSQNLMLSVPDFFGYNKNRELQYRGRFEMKNLEL